MRNSLCTEICIYIYGTLLPGTYLFDEFTGICSVIVLIYIYIPQYCPPTENRSFGFRSTFREPANMLPYGIPGRLPSKSLSLRTWLWKWMLLSIAHCRFDWIAALTMLSCYRPISKGLLLFIFHQKMPFPHIVKWVTRKQRHIKPGLLFPFGFPRKNTVSTRMNRGKDHHMEMAGLERERLASGW